MTMHDMKNLDLLESITGLIEVNIQIAKLEVKDTVSQIAVKVIKGVAMLVLGLFIVIFGSITLALFLGQWLNNHVWGFGLVTLFYLLILIIIRLAKRQLQLSVEKNVEKMLPGVKKTETKAITHG